MTREIVCPFCGARAPVVDPGGHLLFQWVGPVVHYRCPCGAIAFHTPWLCQGVQRDEREALETVRRYVGAGPRVGLALRWGSITETDPPEFLLWAPASGATGSPRSISGGAT